MDFRTQESSSEQKHKLPFKNLNNNNYSQRTTNRTINTVTFTPVTKWGQSQTAIEGFANDYGQISWPRHTSNTWTRSNMTGLSSLLWRMEEFEFMRRRMIEVRKRPILMDSFAKVKDEPIVDRLKLEIIQRVNESVATNNIMQVHLTSFLIFQQPISHDHSTSTNCVSISGASKFV